MGDEMVCPECRDYLQLPYRCVCGWRLDNRHQKMHTSRRFCVGKDIDGALCKNVPTHQIGKNWLCTKHARQEMGADTKLASAEGVKNNLIKIYTLLGKPNLAREVNEKPVRRL